jgi:hypothetical protein
MQITLYVLFFPRKRLLRQRIPFFFVGAALQAKGIVIVGFASTTSPASSTTARMLFNLSFHIEVFWIVCRNVSLIFSMTIGTIKKELSAKPCRGPSFCFGKKKQKPWAAIIIPPIHWTDDPARAERHAAGMHRQIKAKKQSRPEGICWIHSDAPAVYTASESVLWPRKYCLTESGRRGSLFPRRPCLSR